jgi:hypothetical protein
MKENISVEAGKCCTDRLNQTFGIARYSLRGRQVLPQLGKQLFVPGPPNWKSEILALARESGVRLHQPIAPFP